MTTLFRVCSPGDFRMFITHNHQSRSFGRVHCTTEPVHVLQQREEQSVVLDGEVNKRTTAFAYSLFNTFL